MKEAMEIMIKLAPYIRISLLRPPASKYPYRKYLASSRLFCIATLGRENVQNRYLDCQAQLDASAPQTPARALDPAGSLP